MQQYVVLSLTKNLAFDDFGISENNHADDDDNEVALILHAHHVVVVGIVVKVHHRVRIIAAIVVVLLAEYLSSSSSLPLPFRRATNEMSFGMSTGEIPPLSKKIFVPK